MTNRLKGCLHTPTRWPARPGQRAQLARTTIEFIAALERIYAGQPEAEEVADALSPLFRAATEHLSLSAEIGGEA